MAYVKKELVDVSMEGGRNISIKGLEKFIEQSEKRLIV